jgi:hypothetical protein
MLKCTSQVEEHNGRKTVVSMIWKEDVAAKNRRRMYVTRLRDFGDRGFASLKSASSLPPGSPISRYAMSSFSRGIAPTG